MTETTPLVSASEADAIAMTRFKRWRDDPVRFWQEFTGFKATTWQALAGRAVALDPVANPKKKRRFVIHSGHNIGKTAFAANLAWWWTATRPFSVVVDTAPTYERQVCKIFWGEMRKWGTRIGAVGDFEMQKSQLKWNVPADLKAKIQELTGTMPGDWIVTGESAANQEAIAGYHSPYGVLVLIDEASGVDDGIFEALEGAISDAKGDFRIVLTGNPTKRDGEFYRARYDDRYEHRYWRLTESTWNSEVADTKAWCQEMLDTYGESSPVYRSRVLGLPPDDNPSALIPFSAIKASNDRYYENTDGGGGVRAVIGVDVAREGDDKSVIVTRIGDYVADIQEYSGQDSFMLSEKVVQAIMKTKGVYSSVNVDAIGYGSGVVDVLRRLKSNGASINVTAVNVAEGPEDDRFLNKRAEYYWRLRDWMLSPRACLPAHKDLEQELVAINTKFPHGKIQIEEKSLMKKRLGRSPDFADALMLTFATASTSYKWAEVKPTQPTRRSLYY